MSTRVVDVARRAYDAGLCVVPPREDGSKAPDGSWKRYQESRPPADQMKSWYVTGDRSGIGLICGSISGNLECFEFDDRDTYDAFILAADHHGLGELVERIRVGYEEETPGHGVHWLYRCAELGGNTKLAGRPAVVDADGQPKVDVLIETRGQGGYVIIAPTNGRVHPNGGAYRVTRGDVATIQTITTHERRELHRLARTFDELPRREYRPSATSPSGDADDIRPGADFNARADWRRDVLEPAGWSFVYQRGGVDHWRRPGKDAGVSATTNFANSDLFCCFSTSTPFEIEAGYAKWRVYAILHHGGDFAVAARALSALGYGSRGTPTRRADSAGTGSAERDDASTVTPSLPNVPAFPLDALSDLPRHFVMAAAESVGVPVDFVAVPMLAHVGAVLGRNLAIELKSDFIQYPILWTAVVGRPGTGKTPADDAVFRPLRMLQDEAKARYDAAITDFERDDARWKSGPDDVTRGERPVKPRLEHLFTTDVTKEAIGGMLAASPGVVVVRDELVGWVRSFDAYRSKGSDRQDWLSLHAGKVLKVDRKTQEPVYISDPVACVSGGVQPDMLSGLADEAGRDDGFVQRFCFAWPDAEPMAWTDATVSTELTLRIAELYRTLRRTPEGHVRLSPDARALWMPWYNETTARAFATRGLMAGFLSKLPLVASRLALVLHCLAHPADAIDVRITATTLAGALDLADYFLAHAARVLAAMRAATIETHSTPERTAILADVRRHGPTGPAEVAERLGKNPSTVRTLMVKMANAALLSKAGYGLYQCVDVDTVDTSSRSIRQPIDTVDTVDVRGGTVAQVSTVSMSTVNQHAVLDQCRVCGRPLRNAAERAAGVHDYACGNNQPDF